MARQVPSEEAWRNHKALCRHGSEARRSWSFFQFRHLPSGEKVRLGLGARQPDYTVDRGHPLAWVSSTWFRLSGAAPGWGGPPPPRFFCSGDGAEVIARSNPPLPTILALGRKARVLSAASAQRSRYDTCPRPLLLEDWADTAYGRRGSPWPAPGPPATTACLAQAPAARSNRRGHCAPWLGPAPGTAHWPLERLDAERERPSAVGQAQPGQPGVLAAGSPLSLVGDQLSLADLAVAPSSPCSSSPPSAGAPLAARAFPGFATITAGFRLVSNWRGPALT